MAAMSTPFDAVVFDLDGTLWDSAGLCARSWSVAARSAHPGHPGVTVEAVGRVMGLPHEAIFRTLFPELDERARSALGEACYEQELADLRREGAPLYPDVAELMPRLAERFPLFIVSNCLTEYLRLFLDGSGIGGHFRDALCYGMTQAPKEESLRRLRDKHRFRAPVYVGDTAGDQRAARAAGYTYLHVDYGFGRPDTECLEFKDFASLTAFLLAE
jgi:phosphoglycolate phosphatase